MSHWGGLDFFIFLILVMNTLLGMARGASKEIISMLCLCVAMIFTIKFTIPLSNFVNSSPLITDVIQSQFVQNFMQAAGMPPLTEDMVLHFGYCVSMLLCFTSIFSVCEAALAYTGIVEAYPFPYAALNRKIGGSLGAVRGFVISLVLIMILEHMFLGQMPPSYFVHLFEPAAQRFDQLIIQQAPEKYKEVLEYKNLYNYESILKELQNPTSEYEQQLNTPPPAPANPPVGGNPVGNTGGNPPTQ